jgi:signal transduction histidine kinase
MLGWVLDGRIRASIAVTVGLMLAASMGVQFNGGLVEAHFLFFALLGYIALYQDWRPYGLAVAWVILSHGLIGVVSPESIYDQPAAQAAPWTWAGIHGGFILLAAVGYLVFWKVSEVDQLQRESALQRMLVVQSRAMEVQSGALEDLRRTEQLKTDLLAIVSHEFRTPLTNIIGFAQTLELSDTDEGLAPQTLGIAVDRIQRNAQRLGRLIGNMMAVAQPAVRGAEVDQPLYRMVSRLASESAQILDTNSQMQIDIPRDLIVRGHPEHLRLILTNLIENGLKFAAQGTDPSVRAEAVGAEVAVTFFNHGPPIPPEMRERIFNPFVQVDTGQTRTYDGLGMGLHVVHILCQAYGSQLDLHCEDRQVTLQITLPRASAQDEGPASGELVRH